MNYVEQIMARAHEEAQRHLEDLERACEEALQGGMHGVLDVFDPETHTWTCTVSSEVPYGNIHSYPQGRQK